MKYFLILITIFSLSSCAKFWNRVESDGGLIGTYKGDYIVLNQSGGKTLDVWKLKDVIVQSETNTDGWLFKDNEGNIVNLGGDVVVIRIKNEKTWNRYKECHTYSNSYSSCD